MVTSTLLSSTVAQPRFEGTLHSAASAPGRPPVSGHLLWHQTGKKAYDPAVTCTHWPDSGMLTSMAAWAAPGAADLQRIFGHTSHIVDSLTRVRLNQQLLGQFASERQASPNVGAPGRRSSSSSGSSRSIGSKGKNHQCISSPMANKQPRRPGSAPAGGRRPHQASPNCLTAIKSDSDRVCEQWLPPWVKRTDWNHLASINDRQRPPKSMMASFGRPWSGEGFIH